MCFLLVDRFTMTAAATGFDYLAGNAFRERER